MRRLLSPSPVFIIYVVFLCCISLIRSLFLICKCKQKLVKFDAVDCNLLDLVASHCNKLHSYSFVCVSKLHYFVLTVLHSGSSFNFSFSDFGRNSIRYRKQCLSCKRDKFFFIVRLFWSGIFLKLLE